MEKAHYVKYLIIVLAFLFLFFGTYRVASNYLAVVSLSPGEARGVAPFNTFLNFYVNLSPALSGILIVGALGLMVLIVVESRRGV